MLESTWVKTGKIGHGILVLANGLQVGESMLHPGAAQIGGKEAPPSSSSLNMESDVTACSSHTSIIDQLDDTCLDEILGQG